MTQQSGGDASGPNIARDEDDEEYVDGHKRTSMSLAIPDGANALGASVEIKPDQVAFTAYDVEINCDGLFIEGKNVSQIHQDDLRILGELGRGACSVVKQAQVRRSEVAGGWEDGGTRITAVARVEVLPPIYYTRSSRWSNPQQLHISQRVQEIKGPTLVLFWLPPERKAFADLEGSYNQ